MPSTYRTVLYMYFTPGDPLTPCLRASIERKHSPSEQEKTPESLPTVNGARLETFNT